MMNRFQHDDELARQVKHYVSLLRCNRTFIEAVHDLSRSGISYKEAFEQVEEELEQKTGLRHYPSGYDSFRACKTRVLKKRK